MNCTCPESCELREELLKAKDKYGYLNRHCLPPDLAGNYTVFPKETLKCSACCLEVVKQASRDREIILTFEQWEDVIEKLNRSTFYYLMYDELHADNTPRWRKWLNKLRQLRRK